MLPKPLSVLLVLCEKILNEADGIVSAIRIVDVFYIPIDQDVTSENHIVLLNVLVSCKFSHDDKSTHSITLVLKRPDGTEKDVEFGGRPFEVALAELTPKMPGAPFVINLIAPWGVRATHMGLHRLALRVDGEEVATALFTLAWQPAPKDDGE